jgi:hypothetical protein
VNTTRYQIELCVFGLRQLIELVPLTRVRVRPELRELLLELEDMLSSTSEDGSGFVSAAEELTVNDPINTAIAAEILDCTPRWVCDIAEDLGGLRCGWGWVFDRRTVELYADERRRR